MLNNNFTGGKIVMNVPKYDDKYPNLGLTMTDKFVHDFVGRLGRCELFGLRDSREYENYRKAITVTLDELGYDRDWIEEVFVPTFDEFYSELLEQLTVKRLVAL